MDLLERDDALAAVGGALAEAASGNGRAVLVAGEAGVGKSSLVTAVLAAHGASRRFLVGGCDPLLTPRALGPFHDIARQAGGGLAAAFHGTGRREVVVAALLGELDASPPRVLVIEDVHWADEGTLDLIALLGRRVGMTTGTLVATLRPDEAGDRLRATLGELPGGVVRRIDLAPLGEESVAELARRAGRSAADLYGMTGGNPFYVTEVLASAGERVPGSVRDAVLARAQRLSAPGRQVLEIVSVVPGRAETWLVRETLGADPAAPVDECVAAGMLELEGARLRFRHEIARTSVEGELSPMRRRELDRRVLAVLGARGGVDPARLVHHARRSGERDAILAAAPAAARAAGAAGAHVQAAEHYRAALEEADGLTPAGRAELLEGLSYEAYLSGSPQEALETRREALRIRSSLDQMAEAGEDERWLSRLLWWAGRREESEAAAERAIALLEPLGPGHGLAMAYSTLSQLMMLAWRTDEAVAWGGQAIALARELGDRETLAHALNNVGTALVESSDDAGSDMLEEAIDIATADGQHDHAVRAMVNLAWGRLLYRRYDEAFRILERGLAFARANDLLSYDQYLLGMRAWGRLETGDWRGAEEDGRAMMAIDEFHRAISAYPGMVALGRLLVRRGEPEGRRLLEDAWQRAVVADEAPAPNPGGVRLRRDGLAGGRPGRAAPPRRGRHRGRRPDDRLTQGPHGGRGALLVVAGGGPDARSGGLRGAVPPLDDGRFAGRGAGLGGARVPVRRGRRPDGLRRRGRPAPGARHLRPPRRHPARRPAARAPARARRRLGATGPAARDRRRAARPHRPPERGPGAARRGPDQRPDRPAPGDLGADRRPSRGRGAAQARRGHPGAGRRRPGRRGGPRWAPRGRRIGTAHRLPRAVGGRSFVASDRTTQLEADMHLHLHPHIHTALARDTQARRLAEARTADAARAHREPAAAEPAVASRRWMPFRKGRLTTSPQRQGA